MLFTSGLETIDLNSFPGQVKRQIAGKHGGSSVC